MVSPRHRWTPATASACLERRRCILSRRVARASEWDTRAKRCRHPADARDCAITSVPLPRTASPRACGYSVTQLADWTVCCTKWSSAYCPPRMSAHPLSGCASHTNARVVCSPDTFTRSTPGTLIDARCSLYMLAKLELSRNCLRLSRYEPTATSLPIFRKTTSRLRSTESVSVC